MTLIIIRKAIEKVHQQKSKRGTSPTFSETSGCSHRLTKNGLREVRKARRISTAVLAMLLESQRFKSTWLVKSIRIKCRPKKGPINIVVAMAKVKDPVKRVTKQGELRLASFLVEHNLSINTVGHLLQLCLGLGEILTIKL